MQAGARLITVVVPNHRVMGIDASLKSTGVGSFDERGVLVGAWRVRPERGTESVHERACSIAWQIGDLMATTRPGFVYIEAPFIGVGGKKTALTLGVLQGAISSAVHIASARKITVNPLTSSEWRKLIGCKNTKPAALAHIQWLLRDRGIPFADYCEDEIEAVGIAEAGRLELARIDP